MDSRLDEISIDREQIGHALKDKRLSVPPNQRDYAWKEKHVDDLYSDFALTISRGAAEYFLGSIVVIKKDEGFIVVDGQQRLATSLIFIAAIRDFYVEEKDEDAAKHYEFTYLLSKPSRSKEAEPHLYLNDRDHAYFTARILQRKNARERKNAESSKPKVPSHNRIDKAAKLAAKRVKDIVSGIKPEDRAERLDTWVDFLENKARVIWVTVPDESSAYVIFETMNDRGLELSATDLIKNYLFGRAESRRIEAVKSSWLTMMGVLDAASIGAEIVKDFVRHFWIANNGVIRSAELFESIKRHVKSPAIAVRLADELAQESKKYVALLSASSSFWNDYPDSARQSIETLNLLAVEQIRPLLLAALGRFSPKDMAALLSLCVSWSVRLFIAGTQGSGATESLYGIAAQGITDKSIKSLSELTKHISKAIPTDDKFRNDFAEASVGKAHLARYYLRSLERQFKNEAEPYFIPNDKPVINREHIMPENPSTDWGGVPEEIRDTYTSRLGNQVLLRASVNSTLGNQGWNVKKPKLLEAEFHFTKMAGEYENWGKEEIEGRQKRMAEYAAATWPLKIK
jgi:hypothetical protein